MEFLPRTIGTRPRLACEVRAEGVVAARAEDASAVLAAVSRVALAERGVVGGDGAGVRWVGSAAERSAIVAAVRKALEAVGGRGRGVTLVVPDAAVRVLLLDFDELPAKAAEALPVVRFRLKKLLPFDADDAAVSYQVLASGRGQVQVLAVAMPQETLKEYESVVRDAGYEPGAVLPSTLAALAGLEESERPTLVVNAGREAVTTAIVRGGILLLHRTVDLGAGSADTAASDAKAAKAVSAAGTGMATATGAAAGASAVAPVSAGIRDDDAREAARDTTIASIAARFAAMESQTPAREPISRVNSALASSAAMQSGAGMPSSPAASEAVQPGEASGATASTAASAVAASPGPAIDTASEVEQAVSVAAAYFEDTLETSPQVMLSAGTLGAEALGRLLDAARDGMGMGMGIVPVRVQEMVDREMLGAGASDGVPPGWLAGVRGALKN